MVVFGVFTLAALGSLLILIAGFVGAKPFTGLVLKPDAVMSEAQLTGLFGALRIPLLWSMLLFAVGGCFVFIAFFIFAVGTIV
jgi:hypothetical protein